MNTSTFVILINVFNSFLVRNKKELPVYLFINVIMVLICIYYNYYYDKLNKILSENEMIKGPMITSERYALTKEETCNIVYESSYNTHTFGSDSNTFRPSWTSETKYKTEKNKRVRYILPDDLRIGDTIMKENEYTFDEIEYCNIDWQRGPIVNYTDNGLKISLWHIYPKNSFVELVVKHEFDFYKVKLINTKPKPLSVQFMENEDITNKLALTVSTIALFSTWFI